MSGKHTSHRVLWGLLLVVGCLSAYGISQSYERVREERDLGYSDRALRNPYLAAEQYLSARARVTSSSFLPSIETLAPTGTLVLALSSMLPNDARVEAVLAWVEDGGRLIVGAPFMDDADDALLAALDLHVYDPTAEDEAASACSTGVLADDAATAELDAQPSSPWYQEWGFAKLPAAPQTPAQRRTFLEQEATYQTLSAPTAERLRVTVNMAETVALWHPSMANGEQPPPAATDSNAPSALAWEDAEGNPKMVLMRHGAGEVYVLADTDIWRTPNILLFDHAFLLAQLVRLEAPVHILYGARVAGLWQRLAAHFPEALLAFAATLLFWLWSRVVRLGPIRNPLSRHRRALAEHIRHVALFTWQSREPLRLVANARAGLWPALLRQYPHLHRVPREQSLLQLREAMALDDTTLARALDEQRTVETPQEFVHTIKAIQTLRKAL